MTADTVYTSTTAALGSDLVAKAYDTFARWQLRSLPMFSQLVDVYPVSPTHQSNQVQLTIINELADLVTSAAPESSDPDSVTQPASDTVTVTMAEYLNPTIQTLKFRRSAFMQVDPIVSEAVGKNMIDSVDKMVQTVIDGATHVIGLNNAVLASEGSGTAYADASVKTTDVMASKLIRASVALLRGRSAAGRAGSDTYVGLVHPDVSYDIRGDDGWLDPHNYRDTMNIYNGEVGTYLGVRWLETPRGTVTAKADITSGLTDVYTTYVLGAQAVVEAAAIPPHIVIGPQTDVAKRLFPISWYGFVGWNIYRQAAIQRLRSASSLVGV